VARAAHSGALAPQCTTRGTPSDAAQLVIRLAVVSSAWQRLRSSIARSGRPPAADLCSSRRFDEGAGAGTPGALLACSEDQSAGRRRSARKTTRPNRVAAIENAMRELTDLLPEGRGVEAVAVITYLCSSNSWLTISDETGVSTLRGRRSVMWALETLLASLQEEVRAGISPCPTASDDNRNRKDHEQ